MRPYADNPRLWRERAEEARVHAEQMHDPEARETMLSIAEGYEKMAEHAEQRLAEGRHLSS